MKIFIDISHNPGVYSKCKQKIVNDKGKRKMKKALAVLVIMMVALVAVFAETTTAESNSVGSNTITLKHTVQESPIEIKVYYQDQEVSTKVDNDADLSTTGSKTLTIKIKGNSASNYSRKITFTATDFVLGTYNESGVFVPEATTADDRKVTTKLSFDNLVDNKKEFTIAKANDNNDNKQEFTITYNKYHNIAEMTDVATGTFGWTGNDALVAGSYQATITVSVAAL